MFRELYEIFKDDYIKVGKYRAIPFGPAWWIIRVVEMAAAMFLLYWSVVGAVAFL